MNRYIAAIIDTMNRGGSLEELMKPAGRIRGMIDLYKKGFANWDGCDSVKRVKRTADTDDTRLEANKDTKQNISDERMCLGIDCNKGAECLDFWSRRQ